MWWFIHLREVVSELGFPPSWTDFISTIQELYGAPPNAFKSMPEENLRHHFDFITEFWEYKVDFKEWNEGQVVPVTKSEDLSDPNKWRGVSLMDIGAKVFSSLICKRLFKIIKKHRVKYQFWSSPVVGCQYSTFYYSETTPHATQPQLTELRCICRHRKGVRHLQS